MIENFVVVEGICCSGKTTLCNNLIKELENKGKKGIYNHGALTYTDIGRKFYKIIDNMSVQFSTFYYFTDLIYDTQNKIKSSLDNNIIVIQDRYIESIATYKSAYGKFKDIFMDVYPAVDVLLEMNLLIKPKIEVYCIPSINVILDRMKNAENTEVHKYYKENPKFLQLVYDNLKKVAYSKNKSIIVDTDNNDNIDSALLEIKQRLSI